MNDYDKAWKKLVVAARAAPRPDGDEKAPYGFSTRVAALAFEARPERGSAFARVSLRAAFVACLFALVAVGANYSAIRSAFSEDDAAPGGGDDPVSEVVDLAS